LSLFASGLRSEYSSPPVDRLQLGPALMGMNGAPETLLASSLSCPEISLREGLTLALGTVVGIEWQAQRLSTSVFLLIDWEVYALAVSL